MVAIIVLVLAAEAVDEDAKGNAADDSNKDADDQTKAGRFVLIAKCLGAAVQGEGIEAA